MTIVVYAHAGKFTPHMFLANAHGGDDLRDECFVGSTSWHYEHDGEKMPKNRAEKSFAKFSEKNV